MIFLGNDFVVGIHEGPIVLGTNDRVDLVLAQTNTAPDKVYCDASIHGEKYSILAIPEMDKIRSLVQDNWLQIQKWAELEDSQYLTERALEGGNCLVTIKYKGAIVVLNGEIRGSGSEEIYNFCHSFVDQVSKIVARTEA